LIIRERRYELANDEMGRDQADDEKRPTRNRRRLRAAF